MYSRMRGLTSTASARVILMPESESPLLPSLRQIGHSSTRSYLLCCATEMSWSLVHLTAQ